jgi:hypothetical protein
MTEVSEQDVIIKASAWKGLTFADFDKTPCKAKKNGNNTSPTGWMMLATAQQIDLEKKTKTKKEKKKKKEKSQKKKENEKTETTVLGTDPSKKKTEKKTSKTNSTKFLSPWSQNGGGDMSNLDAETFLVVDKPVSTSELTATTIATMTASERSEEDHPIVAAAAVALIPLVEEDETVVTMNENEDATFAEAPSKIQATSPQKQKIKKKKIKKHSPEEKHRGAKTAKNKVKSSPSSTKKRIKTIIINPLESNTDVTVKAKLEERLQEIQKLEKLLKEERKAIQSHGISLASDQPIKRYIIHQVVERTDQMALTIEGLQERVVQMQQQQELDVFQQDSQERAKLQEHVLELQGIIQKQEKEIQELKTILRDVDQKRMLVDDDEDHVPTQVETKTVLPETLESLEDQYQKDRLEWQKIIDFKDATIAALHQEVETLKTIISLDQARSSIRGTGNTAVPSGHISADGDVTRNDPNVGATSGIAEHYIFSTPDPPKSAKKEKVSIEGMCRDAFKPPLVADMECEEQPTA